jgi:type II secretory pathway pseudopilin PulG
MDAVSIVVLVVVAIVVLLAVGGFAATRKRHAAESAALHARAQEADQHLAAAHAEDKGWERGTLEAAARRAYAERHGREPAQLTLVQVVDRPGVEEDEAVFEADGDRLVLGRAAGDWVARA